MTDVTALPAEVPALVRLAVHAVGRGDPQAWQHAVEQAYAADPAQADRLARAELADRVTRHGVQPGMVSAIAGGVNRLAAAAADGPFECPAYLLELAIRRALDEPGCTDFVDQAELVFATTQCAGMIDLHDTLLPPGWGWAVHGSFGESA